jgi:D-alanine-D-alanine ligase
LDVALVYNMKAGISDDVASEDGDPNKRIATRGSSTSTTPLHQTNADTYAEWDTAETIHAVQTALEQHHDVTLIEANEEAYDRFRAVRPTIVFNIAEGLRGPSREAQIPAMLEMLGIPYSGSDPLTLGICLDKSRAKEILSHYQIPTPAFAVIHSPDELRRTVLPLPAIVKPLHEGSSKGIFNASVVRTRAELEEQVRSVLTAYAQPALVEKFLTGREFTVALLGNGADLRVLPVVEIRFDSLPAGVNPIYSYEAKWVWDTLENPIDVHECPAKIDADLERRIKEVCVSAFRVLNCRDWSRIDVRLDDRGVPNIIELNPLPGILPNPEEHSCFPQAARVAGMDYNTMINAVMSAAIKRHGLAS